VLVDDADHVGRESRLLERDRALAARDGNLCAQADFEQHLGLQGELEAAAVLARLSQRLHNLRGERMAEEFEGLPEPFDLGGQRLAFDVDRILHQEQQRRIVATILVARALRAQLSYSCAHGNHVGVFACVLKLGRSVS
jgi:hypothetical protein